MCAKKGLKVQEQSEQIRHSKEKSVKNSLDWECSEVQVIFFVLKHKLVNLVVCIHCVFEGGGSIDFGQVTF